MKPLPSTASSSQGTGEACRDHRFEIDPLRSPPVLRCRARGAVNALSSTEARWPSGKTHHGGFKRPRHALGKILYLTMILIFAAIIVIWALKDRPPQVTVRPKAPEPKGKISSWIDERVNKTAFAALEKDQKLAMYAAKAAPPRL